MPCITSRTTLPSQHRPLTRGQSERIFRGMARPGRPTLYSQELADRICTELSEGKTLRAICRQDGMPDHSTVLLWVRENVNGIHNQYARAREDGYHVMAEDVLAIADDGSNDTYPAGEDGEVRTDHDVIARSRLRFDARRWLLSKALPKIYGDKLDVGVSATGPLAELFAEVMGQTRGLPALPGKADDDAV